jgi:hypothetical protein
MKKEMPWWISSASFSVEVITISVLSVWLEINERRKDLAEPRRPLTVSLFSPSLIPSKRAVKGGLSKFFSLLIIFLTYGKLYDPLSAKTETTESKFFHIVCTQLRNGKHRPGACGPRNLTYIIHIFYSRTKMRTLVIDKGGHLG